MGSSGNSLHVQFGGICEIANLSFDLFACVADKGVVLAGRLLPGTVPDIGEVIDMLAKKFSITSLPGPVRSLQLKDLSFSYHTLTSTFEFICKGGLVIEETPVEMSVRITTGSTTTFTGEITIQDLVFDVCFDTAPDSNVFVATFRHAEKEETPVISLHDFVQTISKSAAQLIPESLVIDLKEAEFIFYKKKEQKQFLFGLQLSAGIDLKNIPVVGDKLPDTVNLSIRDLQVLFASAAFTKEQLLKIDTLLPEGFTRLPSGELSKGLRITGELHVRELVIPINAGSKEPSVACLEYDETFIGTSVEDHTFTAVSPEQITWFKVDKKLGPVVFQRIGVAFEDGDLSFALDAFLALGPAQLTMSGLTVGSSLSGFKPVFGLQGFFFSLQTSGFELGGGFLRSTSQSIEAYYGIVQATAGTFSFSAMGGHTPAHQDPDDPDTYIPAGFFIYANIKIPVGGPPYFNLKGFAGGFGINNRLILPGPDDLAGYILLPGPGSKAPEQKSSPEATIQSVLPKMQKYFIAEAGQYWIAAGIYFSSFEMIEAFAVVTVSFGVEFQIALIGSYSMTLPKGVSRPVAYLEIAIIASYTQSSGLLAVVGVISPASYLFGDFCHITGSVAFYIWIDPPALTGGPRPGEFLVSIGGYHPGFEIPDYYPTLTRLGLNFNLSPLQVKGEAYFAMTPSMMMIGGRLEAVWKLGVIRAWFTLGIDFIMAWAPFHYAASGYFTIGCSVDLGLFTLKVSISAQVELWGSPFGGKADVDLGIVSFQIAFGEKQTKELPLLTWEEFHDRFLPAGTTDTIGNEETETSLLKASVTAGLVSSEKEAVDWLLDSHYFKIRISTPVPANRVRIGNGEQTWKEISPVYSEYNYAIPPVERSEMPYLVFPSDNNRFSDQTLWNPEVHIRPMGKNNVTSGLDVELYRVDEKGEYSASVVELTLRPIVADAAGALWDKYTGVTSPGDAAFLSSACRGMELSPILRIPSFVSSVPIGQLLFMQGHNYWYSYENQRVDTSWCVSSAGTAGDGLEIVICKEGDRPVTMMNEAYMLTALTESGVAGNRNRIFRELAALGFDVYEEAELDCLGTKTALTDWPEIVKLGDTC